MHFISPKKFCISIVFNSLGTAVYPGEMKIKGYAKFGGRGGGGGGGRGANKVHYGKRGIGVCCPVFTNLLSV